MVIYSEETVAKNEAAHLFLHSPTSMAFSISVFSETGNASCNANYNPLHNTFEKVTIDGVDGCFGEGKNIEVPDMEIRTYTLIHGGYLYNPGFSWKTGEKDSKLIELMMSTFKFL